MTRADDTELIDTLEEFYRNYYREDIGELAQKYPVEQKSLYVDMEDLYRFDPDLADDFRNKPRQSIEFAEEALRLYDLPVDVSLEQAHVRVQNLPDTTAIRDIRADTRGTLISVKGIVRKTTDVRSKITDAAFECQRCGTLSRIPQTNGDFQEPHECQGCERQGPFRINFGMSEFVDAQTMELVENPDSLSGGAVPEMIEVKVRDDLTGAAVAGDTVTLTGICKLEQAGSSDQPKNEFEEYLSALSIKQAEPDQPRGSPSSSTSEMDLKTYGDAVATALSTIPDNPREEETKAKLITPLIEALGWNKYDSDEVRLEYTDSKTNLRPDYALFGKGSETPDVIIEAKQLNTNLHTKEEQLQNYLRVFSAEWGLLTNGQEFFVYRCCGEDNLPEKYAEVHVSEVPEADIVKSLRREEISQESA